MNISEQLNDKPVIGILTMPLTEMLGESSSKSKSFLPDAYVRWIENSGARVVPIQYNLTKPMMLGVLSQINGVIIFGEAGNENFIKTKNKKNPDIIRWMKAAFIIYEFAKYENHQDNYFPLLGIGMGYEELYFMEANTNYYKNLGTGKRFSSNKLNDLVKIPVKRRPLRLTKTLDKFARFSKKDIKSWSKNKVMYSTNHYGINVKHGDFLQIHAKDKSSSKEFITMYSFKEYPFYGFIFHPEMVYYNWANDKIPNKNVDVTVDFSQKMSNFFVDECRQNNTQLKSKKILIYNYTLYSPSRILQLLYPDNWESVQFKKHFTPMYFFGLVGN